MKIVVILISTFFLPLILFCQDRQFVIHNTVFTITADSVKNEWNTYDKINKLYRKENGKLNYLLTYYTYRDEGGDCNNSFWHEETLEIKNDSLVFLTHYYQHTGLDPIPEWRKQIYKVSGQGRLNRVYDKEKYYGRKKWIQTGSAAVAGN
ncbi:hypothetical protein ACFS6H_15350 [Terrimonas rubra]|uniref:Uncharacterized protein n=1 Tax=Terrimonas rubra TaxID=1035890 RepID=A0ABW6A844_9BACT